MKLIVFSDLDATLLDEESYSFAAASPALAALRRRRVPLILATSKTRAEVEPLRVRLGNRDPFVVENGGGIFFPADGGEPRFPGIEPAPVVERVGAYHRVTRGVDYPTLRDFVRERRSRYGVRGFGDMTDEEVAHRTGLSLEEAGQARCREFTEPLLIDDEESLPHFEREAARVGLALTRGGRFHHLVGANQDKGAAVPLVVAALCPDGDTRTVGLGDSVNDRSMLDGVDLAVVIPRPDGSRLRLRREDARVAGAPGSRGWNEAVLRIVEETYE